MYYIRAHVDPIQKHLDPIAVLGEDGVFVAYGLAANDFLRLKAFFSDLNKYGLILVDRKDGNFRFLFFNEVVVIIYPGFKEAIDAAGLSFGADFELKSISKMRDCEDMSKWITLGESERLQAENAAREINSSLRNSRLETLLGPRGVGVVEDLMWESSVFEPLHAVTIMAKSGSTKIDILSMRENLRKIGMDIRQMTGSTNRMLARRRKSRATLMDCAKILFPISNYFEAGLSQLSRTLGIQTDKLSSHFRGYLVKDEDYLQKLVEASRL